VSLPLELFKLKKLQKLYLYGNQFMLLSDEIVHLQNLTTLALSSNCLMEVPMHLQALSKLQSLTLYDNPLLSKEDINELGRLLNIEL
jgi:Leucine-rich repeat (LRR) protein